MRERVSTKIRKQNSGNEANLISIQGLCKGFFYLKEGGNLGHVTRVVEGDLHEHALSLTEAIEGATTHQLHAEHVLMPRVRTLR